MSSPYKAFDQSYVKGFTLIELLCTVAVLGVLASLLVPVFTGARRSAGEAQCTSNLHQLHAATLQWITDNDGRMPDARAWSYNKEPSSSLYPYQISPYLGMPPDRSIDWNSRKSPMKCDTAQAANPSAESTWFRRTYSINAFATATRADGDTIVPRTAGYGYAFRIVQVASPSRMALFMDGGVKSGGGDYASNVGAANLQGSNSSPIQFIHNGSICVVFIDGHIERLSRETMSEKHSDDSSPFWRNSQ